MMMTRGESGKMQRAIPLTAALAGAAERGHGTMGWLGHRRTAWRAASAALPTFASSRAMSARDSDSVADDDVTQVRGQLLLLCGKSQSAGHRLQ